MKKIKNLLLIFGIFICSLQMNAHPYVLIDILDTEGYADSIFLIEVEFINEIDFNGFTMDINLGDFVYEYQSIKLNPERRVDQEISVMHMGNNVLRVMSNSNKYPPNSYNGYDGVLFSFEAILFDAFHQDSLYVMNIDTAYVISGYQIIYPNLSSGNIIVHPNHYYQLTLNVNENHGCVLGDGLYKPGDMALIEAHPEPYYRFVNWTCDMCGEIFSKNQSYIFKVNRDLELTANFNPLFTARFRKWWQQLFKN